MKNVYITMLLTLSFGKALDAQLILTQASHAPVAGDSFIQSEFDSVAVMPRNTGLNQMWNFSGLPAASTPSTVTSFSLPSAIPSASLYPGTTLVEVAEQNVFGFMKAISSPSAGYTGLAFLVPQSFTMTYSDPLILMQFPFTYGSSYSDNFAGTMKSSVPGSGISAGYVTYAGSGTGTLVLPGGSVYTNVLQEKSILYHNDTWQTPIAYVDKTTSHSYLYYHASQKEPLLNFLYVTDSLNEITYYSVTVYKSEPTTTGINEQVKNPGFNLYPNPAKDRFSVSFSNTQKEDLHLEIYNSAGQLVRTEDLSNAAQIKQEIEVGDLPKGIYFVKTNQPDHNGSRRLIVD